MYAPPHSSAPVIEVEGRREERRRGRRGEERGKERRRVG